MGQQRIATLRMSLKGYVAPDASKASEGRVAVGRYWVLEEHDDGGDFSADPAAIDEAALVALFPAFDA